MSEFDVAISFSREDHAAASEVERRLAQHGVRVFSYQGRPEETLGHELDERLREVFGATPIVIVLVSASWDGPKTRLELEAALSGAAAQKGIVPVRIGVDEVQLPQALRERTHYDLNRGSKELVQAVARALGRRTTGSERARPWIASATTLIGALVLFALGFRDLSRPQDVLLWLAVAAPIAVLSLETALRSRARKSAGPRLRLQTRFEALWDSATRFALHILALLLVCTLAAAAHTWREVRAEHAVRASLSRDFEGLRRALHAALAKVDSLAMRATTLGAPQDQLEAAKLDTSFAEALASLKEARAAIATRVDGQTALPPAAQWRQLSSAADALVRTADSNFGYQIRELARQPTPGLPAELVRSSREAKVRTLNSYREFWTEQFGELERAGSALQTLLNERVEQHTALWDGVVER